VPSPLEASEVDALMEAIGAGRLPSRATRGTGGNVVPYDLTSQDRIIRGQMPTLDAINDNVASLFGGALGARLRLESRVASSAATLVKFGEVAALLRPPTTVGILSLGAGHGLAAVLLEGSLAFGLLAGALGDRKARAEAPAAASGARSELTQVERLVLGHLLALLCEALATAWREVLGFRPEVLRFESDPRMAVIAPASEVAIVCPFELSGTLEGRFQLVVPYAAVESRKKVLAAPPRPGAGADGDARFSAALARELAEVPVEVRAELGRRTIQLAELLALQVGHVLSLPGSARTPVSIYVEGRLKASGNGRIVEGSQAVALDRPVGSARTRPEVTA
jgi:flagellar motor switch protein FliM